MHPALGLGFIAALLLAFSLVCWAIWRRQHARRHAIRSTRSAVSAVDAAYTIVGPTTLREAEERIPMVDDRGNRHFVIRTRTLETVLGPIGPVEVVRQRRLTLPGHGHVSALSDTEFEIFHSHTRLRIDGAAPVAANRAIGWIARRIRYFYHVVTFAGDQRIDHK